MQTKSLITTCNDRIIKFYEEISAFDIKTKENKKQAVWEIIHNLSKIEIVYLKKGSVMHAPSVLYARIYPNKNDYFFFLTHELNILDTNSLSKPYIYPYIENEKRMSVV